MNGNLTFSIIKPDAYPRQEQIMQQIISAGFEVIGMKTLWLTPYIARQFYSVHKDKPFFNNLIKFMTSGSIVVLVLKHTNAIETYRDLIGDTDPTKSEKGTIRNLYGTAIDKNAIHGADSDANALKEIKFFFPELNLV
jgi:nucleoside-diphosphate kinase